MMLLAIHGSSEDCYDPEFIRALALMQAADEEHERLEAKATIGILAQRLAAKHGKNFGIKIWKDFIAAETERLKAAAVTMRQEQKERRGDNWRDRLVMKAGKGDQVAPCEASAILYLENHPKLKGVLGYNEFTNGIVILKPTPFGLLPGQSIEDHHDTLFQTWFQHETKEPGWRIDTVRRACECVARKNPFHPIKQYLEGLLAWDGVVRLPHWLEYYCGAGPAESDDSPEAQALASFISAIAERWWISAIARIYQPGCKVDHVLVLEGIKGIGKTTLPDIVFGGYFAIITGDVNSKDNQMLLSAGNWCILMDELDVLNKSAMRAIKSYVTATFDKFRPVWGHRIVDRPRACVFMATVNGAEWAREEDRRWWPAPCGDEFFKLDELRADRDLLMAEALHKYRAGQRWHLDHIEDAALIATAKREQAARVEENPDDEKYLKMGRLCASKPGQYPRGTCTVLDIIDALGIPMGHQRKALLRDCGTALNDARWTFSKERDPDTGRQRKRYRPPIA